MDELAHLELPTPSWANIDLDDQGLPIGETARQAWNELLASICSSMTDWDQPALLFSLAGPLHTAAYLAEHEPDMLEKIDDERAAGSLPPTLTCSIEQVAAIEGHPLHTLAGMRMPAEAAGVVLVNEGWVVLNDEHDGIDAPPHAHPRRREIRIATLITRSAAVYSHVRERGGERDLTESVSSPEAILAGHVVDALRRTLDLDTTGPGVKAAHLLASSACDDILRILTGLHHGSTSTGSDLLELYQQARSEDPRSAAHLLVSIILLRLVVQCELLDKEEHDELASILHSDPSLVLEHSEHADALDRAVEQLAGVTWDEMTLPRSLQQTLNAQMPNLSVAWSGEKFYGELLYRYLDDPRELIAMISRIDPVLGLEVSRRLSPWVQP